MCFPETVTSILRCLAGVASERESERALVLLENLMEIAQAAALIVRQRVHRVEDQGADPD
ncbi:MAG: hypothetical protein ACE5D3_03465 [Candidatus Binatia bacterium]